MPCASELQLPQLALDEPCDLRPESAKSSTGSIKASGAGKPARLSILSSDMSVLSNDDVESTFSSLLRSVAEREEGCEEVRSIDGGQILVEEPQEVLSDKSYVVVSDPSGSANVLANASTGGYLAGPPSTSRPKSILAVLDESDDPVKQQNTQTWVQSQLAHLQPAERTGEAGSSIPSLDTREPARIEPVDPFQKQEKTIQSPSTNTTESLCFQSSDASLSIDATALTIGSLASLALEESWRTIATEPLIEDANPEVGGSDSESEPGEDLRIALPAAPCAKDPAPTHELAKHFFGLWLPILSLFAAAAASYFSDVSALLDLNFFRFWPPRAHLTSAAPKDEEQSEAASPSNNAPTDLVEEGDDADYIPSLPDPSALMQESFGDAVQQHIEVVPLLRADLLSSSPSRTPTATRTISTLPPSSIETLVQEHLYPAALACGIFMLVWLAQQASSRIFRPAQRKRKYVVYKRRRPTTSAASTLPKNTLASQSQTDGTPTLVDTPSSKVEQSAGQSRTPRQKIPGKTEVIDDVPMEVIASPDTPRRSPRLAKKALVSKTDTIRSRTWTAKCSQTPSREASPIPARLRARSNTPASPSPVPKADSPKSHSRDVRVGSEGAAVPAPLTCKQDRMHIVRVHGMPNVGKSSIIRSARSLDLPKGKADAGVSARTWSKEGLFTNLVFRDTDVTEEMWQEWSRAPLNAKYMLGEQGRTVHLVIHARNVQLSGPAALITASRLLQEDDSLVVIMLNKTDLSENWSQAQSSKRLEETARYMIDAGIGADVMKRRLRWFAVSADNGNGIGDAFREIARELRREGPTQRVASESMDIDA